MLRTARPLSLLAHSASLVVAVLLCAPAWATLDDMAKLPLAEPFQCLVCHQTNPNESGSFALNVFGDDFLTNGRLWDSELAAKDSDRDGCLNGVELGDADGNGAPDGNVENLSTNPGESDCGATVDLQTWGTLKALFDNR